MHVTFMMAEHGEQREGGRWGEGKELEKKDIRGGGRVGRCSRNEGEGEELKTGRVKG